MKYAVKCVNTKPTKDDLEMYKSKVPNKNFSDWWIDTKGLIVAWCGGGSVSTYTNINDAFRNRGQAYNRYEYLVEEFE